MGTAILETLVTERRLFTSEEYLARERAAEVRSEYDDGDISTMAGASRKHTLITTNVARELGNALTDTECEVYASDMRVRIPNSSLYAYPDVVVVCDDPHFEDVNQDTLLNPSLLIEVLSSSTAAYDRGRKFRNYQSIPSLSEYVLISQKERLAGAFRLQTDGVWIKTGEARDEKMLPLVFVNAVLSLKMVYARVKFP